MHSLKSNPSTPHSFNQNGLSERLSISKNPIVKRKSFKLLNNAKKKIHKVVRNTRREYIGDRFMVHRAFMNFQESEDVLLCRANREERDIIDDLSIPSLIEGTMFPTSKRLLKLTAFHHSPSQANKMKALYDKNNKTSVSKAHRLLSMYPDRILDSPHVSRDCWNLLDWSMQGVLATALVNYVYLWNASSGQVSELTKNTDVMEEVSCVKWFRDANKKELLAVGSDRGKLTFWKDGIKVKTMNNHCESKITAISCSDNLFSVGYASGLIQHYDIYYNMSLLFDNEHHKKAIYQMKWSVNNKYLAVASSDGSMTVWSGKRLDSNHIGNYKENTIGIGGMAWSQKQENVLVIIGGEDNRILKMIDIVTKSVIKSFESLNDTMSNIVWSDSYNEIAVCCYHDNGNCVIKLYDDHSLKFITELTGHKDKIITMVSNASNGLLATIGYDDCIRMWSCFNDEELKKAKVKQTKTFNFFDDLDRFR